MSAKLDAQLARPDVAWPTLAAGEARMCAVRASLPWVRPTAVRILPLGGRIERDELRRRNPLPFELAAEMAIALTSARFVFFSCRGLFARRPRELLGEIPRSEVEKVALSRRRQVLALWLTQGSFELAVRDLDDAAALAAVVSDRD